MASRTLGRLASVYSSGQDHFRPGPCVDVEEGKRVEQMHGALANLLCHLEQCNYFVSIYQLGEHSHILMGLMQYILTCLYFSVKKMSNQSRIIIKLKNPFYNLQHICNTHIHGTWHYFDKRNMNHHYFPNNKYVFIIYIHLFINSFIHSSVLYSLIN